MLDLLRTQVSNKRSFVATATLCERALQERDGVLSAIRIVDTFWVARHPAVPSGVRPVVQVNLLVTLKFGAVRGKYRVRLTIRSPSGTTKTLPAPEGPLLFNGGEHGVNIVATIEFGVEQMGVYWIDVIWVEDGEVLTSVPLRLADVGERALGSPDKSLAPKSCLGFPAGRGESSKLNLTEILIPSAWARRRCLSAASLM